MPLPLTPNTTCDIYRSGNAPPGQSPDVAGVACSLTAKYADGLERGEGDGVTRKFTHVLLVDDTVDIRDGWDAESVAGTADTIYVPDSTGTPFKVVYVERLLAGTAHSHQRVFLSRKLPTWPTLEL